MLPHCFSESTKDSSSVVPQIMHNPHKIDASNRLQRLVSRSLVAVGVLFSLTACAAQSQTSPSQASQSAAQPEAGQAFSYAWLKGYARQLATKPYQSHQGELPDSLKRLDWDDYQEIRFNKEAALWRDQKSEFRTELFHLGLGFDTPIHMNELENGKSTPIPYMPSEFTYGKSKVDGNKLPKDLGFAGFRMQFATDWQRDVVAFLGASYFRAVGSEMQYGLSARGLAIDTAMPHPERVSEFLRTFG